MDQLVKHTRVSACALAVCLPALCVVSGGCGDDPLSTDHGQHTAGAWTPTTGADLSGTGAPQAGGEAAALWCQTRAVMESRCQLCHGPELVGGAPMSLVRHADMLAPSPLDGRPVYQVLGERVHSVDQPMPPLAQGALTAQELAAIDAWISAGAPGSDAIACGGGENADGNTASNSGGPWGNDDVVATDGGVSTTGDAALATPGTIPWPEGCEEFYEIRAQENGQPYRVRANTEERKDFTIAVPWSGEVYALALRPIANNKRVVHHWILYEGAYSMVTSWSPGKEFETFPEGVGVYMPPSGSFRLNMHYYNVGNPEDELDESGVEICITRKPVAHTATTHMFSGSATVPPNGRVVNVGECRVNADGPVHLITSSPHMHSYGVAAKFEVLRSNGSLEVLHDTPFNWEDQTIKPIDVVVNDGDVVRTTCIYENDTNRTIRFGENSADEMCFNFARYYPRGGLSCGGLFGLPL